jgi:hypothetical protein
MIDCFNTVTKLSNTKRVASHRRSRRVRSPGLRATDASIYSQLQGPPIGTFPAEGRSMKKILLALLIALPLSSIAACGADSESSFDTINDGSDVNADSEGKEDGAAGTITAAQFNTAAKDANYISESDSAPTFLSAKLSPGAKITKTYIRRNFGAALGMQADDAMEFSNRTAALAWFDDAGSDEDPASTAAWARIKTLMKGKLKGIVLIKTGPGENGVLTSDQGAYNYLVVGKSADGKVVGFFIESVET